MPDKSAPRALALENESGECRLMADIMRRASFDVTACLRVREKITGTAGCIFL